MDISVVIPTFNRRKTVMRTLETVFSQDMAADAYEVIVVIDGSTDGTTDALSKLRPACRFRIVEQENRGPSAARNAGFRTAQSDFVLFLDDDMLCDRGLIRAHIAAQRALKGGVAFGAVFLSEESPPSLAAECFRREIGAFYVEREQNPQLPWRVAEYVFCNASLPHALLEQSGGFDETLRMREDLEFGIRLHHAGVEPVFLSNAVVRQYFEKTSADLIRDAERFAETDALLARKYPDTFAESEVTWKAGEAAWKQRARRIAAAAPGIFDFFLAPVSFCGEICFGIPALRDLGVRALQMRRRVHWYHKALEFGWKGPSARPRDANGGTA